MIFHPSIIGKWISNLVHGVSQSCSGKTTSTILMSKYDSPSIIIESCSPTGMNNSAYLVSLDPSGGRIVTDFGNLVLAGSRVIPRIPSVV